MIVCVCVRKKKQDSVSKYHVKWELLKRLLYPRGIRLEYRHHSTVGRKRRWKGNPLPGDVTGPPCSRGTWPPGLGESQMRDIRNQAIVWQKEKLKSGHGSQRCAHHHWLLVVTTERNNGLFCLATCCTLVSCSADFHFINMEVILSSETSVYMQTTQYYIPEDNICNYHCENP
jgi:hypothetical protein